MKKILLLLAITLLLQSCFSYKRIEPANRNEMVIGQKYKIVQNHKTRKVILNSISENSITVTEYGKEREIPISEIKSMKERNFSIIKTALLFPATVAVVAIAAACAYRGPEVNGPLGP